MAHKPIRRMDYRQIVYSADRWALLNMYRRQALNIMAALEAYHLHSIVHGSVARGDVTRKSDVDVFIPRQVSSFEVETAMQRANMSFQRRLIVQATPTYAMKAHIVIGENTSISFPLMKMSRVEQEFYKFGGETSGADLREDLRTLGVDKRLILVEPTEKGHKESPVIGREAHVAGLIGISVQTVLDRVRALLRRDSIGRTGVFVEKEVSIDQTFEAALKALADGNPAVRRRLRRD